MLNNVVLMGRITHEPELKQTTSGVKVLRFSLAVERNYAAKGEERQTDFINCVAWRQTAEFISKYFKKGSLIAVEGSIQTRKYEDKDGSQRTAFEVVIDNASFTGEKRDTSAGYSSGGGYDGAEIAQQNVDSGDIDDSGVPF